MVRLLIFWIGRDNVGGGRVSLLKATKKEESAWIDGVEVLLGSDPEKVPGGHNRWGYARELAFWHIADNAGSRILEHTLFEGFMIRSFEESLDEVEEGEDETSVYEGIVCEVEKTGANSKIWRFQSSEEDTYRNPDRIGNEYISHVKTASPFLERVIDNGVDEYERPQGFFTAVRRMSDDAMLRIENNSPLSGLKGAKQEYVYSSKLFSLSLRKVKLHKNLKLTSGEEFEKVVELQMETKHLESGKKHRFILYMATSGDLRGIPVRIEDQPRWWLKVRLDLETESVIADNY
ncbi:MAG: hypothetical protein JXR49_15030 [Acidobacteria bacterium]|nr:hypothetical protein [Acidobacteriota bacterium]